MVSLAVASVQSAFYLSHFKNQELNCYCLKDEIRLLFAECSQQNPKKRNTHHPFDCAQGRRNTQYASRTTHDASPIRLRSGQAQYDIMLLRFCFFHCERLPLRCVSPQPILHFSRATYNHNRCDLLRLKRSHSFLFLLRSV